MHGVIMSNHIHLIVRSKQGTLSDTIRDFKKFPAGKVVEAIKNNKQDSRKSWLLWLLQKEDKICFWQPGCIMAKKSLPSISYKVK